MPTTIRPRHFHSNLPGDPNSPRRGMRVTIQGNILALICWDLGDGHYVVVPDGGVRFQQVLASTCVVEEIPTL